MIQPAFAALAEQLYQRRGSAVFIPQVDWSADGYELQPHECHQNVAWWVAANPDHIHVRGFLVVEEVEVIFVPHSVVQLADGNLVDITPGFRPRPRPFLRHEGSDQDFDRLSGSNVRYRPPPK